MATERMVDLLTGGVSERAYIPSGPPVPTAVTPRQAKLALLAAGKLDAAEAAIAASPREAQITWEYATEFLRGDPLVAGIGSALGLSSKQIDDLFRDAATR